MATLAIPDQLLAQLQEVADYEQQSMTEVLENMLRQHVFRPTESENWQEDNPPVGSLARLALELDRANFHAGRSDLAENSKELLRTEFTDYLLTRMSTEAILHDH